MENSNNNMEKCADYQYEDESSLNLSVCRELISLVRSNELLWKKRCVSYKDQKMKNLCWTSIGNLLTPPLADAEKEFYKLRQKFGREIRKEKENAPRSGAGGQQTYKSEWPLYKDLEFLKDVIKPRRTISNFSKRQSPTPSPPAIIIEDHSSSSIDNSSPACSFWNVEGSPIPDSDGNSLSTSLSTSTASSKRTVPTPDFFYTKKKKTQDSMDIVIEKHSANINMLTDKITKCIENSASPVTKQNEPDDSLILSVSAALTRVPSEKRLSCIIEMLQIVQKYAIEK